jgi:guanylate kinase
MNKIIVICGFSASGKTVISKYIANKYNYKEVISHTSRPIRHNEIEGDSYYFVSKQQFQNMIDNNEFIECRTYNTLLDNKPEIWYYGIHKYGIDLSKNNYVVVLDIHGLRQFKKYYKDNIFSFFIFVNEPTRKQRCINRSSFDETEWNRRYQDDTKQFTSKVIYDEVDYIVENYDYDKCIKEISEKIGEIK